MVIIIKRYKVEFSKYGIFTDHHFRGNSEIVNWFLAKRNYLFKKIMKKDDKP